MLVHRVPASSLKIGDVITHIDVSNPKITLSHRIIKIQTLKDGLTEYTTKGDANKIADRPVAGSQIIGKVVGFTPRLGWALLDAKKPIIVLPLVYIAGLLVMIEEFQRLIEYYRKYAVYRLSDLAQFEKSDSQLGNRFALLATATTAFIVCTLAISPLALAIAHNNTNYVSLTNNRISVTVPPKTSCSGNNSSNVNISNTTNQNAQSGSATSSNGNATSGNASNNNSTTITITTNC